MSDTHSTESTPTAPPILPNDQAARSPTGEILDVRPEPTKTTATTEASPDPSKSTTADTTSAATDAPKPDAPKPTEPGTVPETYADFKLPDGVALAPETLAAAAPVFKELGLNQEQAQKLVDFHAAELQKLASAPKSAFESLNAEWRAAATNDAEIKSYSTDGKTGMDAVQVDIGRALNAIANPALTNDFRKAMDMTGAGNNPAFVKVFWKLSQMIGEGKSVSGGGPSPHGQRATGGPKPTAAQSIYPNLPSANAS